MTGDRRRPRPPEPTLEDAASYPRSAWRWDLGLRGMKLRRRRGTTDDRFARAVDATLAAARRRR